MCVVWLVCPISGKLLHCSAVGVLCPLSFYWLLYLSNVLVGMDNCGNTVW